MLNYSFTRNISRNLKGFYKNHSIYIISPSPFFFHQSLLQQFSFSLLLILHFSLQQSLQPLRPLFDKGEKYKCVACESWMHHYLAHQVPSLFLSFTFCPSIFLFFFSTCLSRELKRERERAELWRGLEEHQERRMQMLTEAARNQRNLQERGERGDPPTPSSPLTAHSDKPEPKPSGASSGAGESAT